MRRPGVGLGRRDGFRGIGGGARAAAFQFSDVDGLAFLYDADSANITLNGSDVSQWDDTSGNGRDVSQATAAEQPGYTESNADFNSKPSVDPDGTDDFLQASQTVDVGTNFLYLFLVAKTIGGGSQRIVDTRGGGNGGFFLGTSSGRIWCFVEDTAGNAASLFEPAGETMTGEGVQKVELHWDPTTQTVEGFLDESSSGTDQNTAMDGNSVNGTVNLRLFEANDWEGEIAIAVGYVRSSALSSEELTSIRAKLDERIT